MPLWGEIGIRKMGRAIYAIASTDPLGLGLKIMALGLGTLDAEFKYYNRNCRRQILTLTQIAHYKIPRHILFKDVTDFPMTVSTFTAIIYITSCIILFFHCILFRSLERSKNMK